MLGIGLYVDEVVIGLLHCWSGFYVQVGHRVLQSALVGVAPTGGYW